MEPLAAEGIQLEEEKEIGVFSCPNEGGIKFFQTHGSLQRLLDVGEHLLALERGYTFDVIKD